MNIMLLGGSGYIGSKFYSNFENTYDIKSIDINLFHNFNYSNEINYAHAIEDEYFSDLIKNADAIICLAGHSSVQMCECSPAQSWINNVDYFRYLCENITDQRLIYASSASVYGSSGEMSTENSPINFDPICHYDLQKITIDMIANKYIKEGKNIIGLRFGTVNGASPHTRKDLMINSMVYNALSTGKVYAKNLHIRRAILGIDDLMRAFSKIIEHDIPSGQYNLSSFNSNVGDIARTVAEECSAELIVGENDAVAYDFEMSTKKFKKQTGFVFNDSIESIVHALKKNHNNTYYSVRNDDGKFHNFM